MLTSQKCNKPILFRNLHAMCHERLIPVMTRTIAGNHVRIEKLDKFVFKGTDHWGSRAQALQARNRNAHIVARV